MAKLFQAFEGASRAFDELDCHLLVVGQSGSGKSYFIGKMVEELGIKTRARVVILDRAGDFVKIWLSSDEENYSGIVSAIHSNWPDEKFHGLVVHPYWFNALDLCAVFGLPYTPAYWGFIGEALRTMPHEYDLSTFVLQIRENLKSIGETLPPDVNLEGINSLTEGLFMRHLHQTYVERYGKSDQFRGFHDTARRVVEQGLLGEIDFLNKAVVHVVDLSSLKTEHARSTLSLAVLRMLWENSREQWWQRHLTKKKAPRKPTFLVMDEAHHLCPAEKIESPIGIRVQESLLEIATEGRKYGLWLIFGTQRPTRLHPTILSETSNFMLMRTTSPADLKFLSELLSKKKIVSDLKKLERSKGFGFLAGEWARNGYEKVKVSSKRTAHIEGRFEPDEWIL